MSDKHHVRAPGEITYTRKLGSAQITATGTPEALREAGVLEPLDRITGQVCHKIHIDGSIIGAHGGLDPNAFLRGSGRA